MTTRGNADFAEIWRGAEKIVYSRTLERVLSERTRIERAFEPVAILLLKSSAAQDLSVGAAGLAAEAIRARLVDEYCYFVTPVDVGGGKSWLPADVRLDLALVGERRCAGGVV